MTPRRRINLVYPNEEHQLGKLHLTGLRTRVAVADWNVDGAPDSPADAAGMISIVVVVIMQAPWGEGNGMVW